uniref:Reverse transcriptase RNase H-like domain-containing protein n=1 Tax=Physcomitrium patens TaxID=3218 RepID=A0A2K1KXJ5_PHYPA|nr:hypothetical protein PHYPA_005486 [Physcomitrium patens]
MDQVLFDLSFNIVGLRAVLIQKERNNNNIESNYLFYKREALEAIWAIAHFQPYLYGQ